MGEFFSLIFSVFTLTMTFLSHKRKLSYKQRSQFTIITHSNRLAYSSVLILSHTLYFIYGKVQRKFEVLGGTLGSFRRFRFLTCIPGESRSV